MKRKKIGFVALATVLGATSLSAFGGCRKGDEISAELRSQMTTRTENAQFMPDAQTVMKAAGDSVGYMNAVLGDTVETEETAFDVFDMERLLQSVAQIDSNGAGKYLGYEVDEIKTEMYNMVNRAPWMNEWFRVPRPDDGIGYFSNWAYLIENDLEYNFLSITRISWRTRASYYDSEKREEIEDYDGGSAIQYNVMRTEYYMDEGTEIVEVEMLDIMQEHGNDHFIAYQGLKNAKDKYFIKYNIEAKPRSRVGYLIDTDTPYGANREFTYLTYEDSDFDLLEIEQRYPNTYRADQDTFGELAAGAEISSVRRHDGASEQYSLTYGYNADGVTPENVAATGENPTNLADAIGDLAVSLGQSRSVKEGYTESIANGETVENATESLLNTLSKDLVDEHYLAENWQEIFQNSENAREEIAEEIDLPIKLKYWNSEISPNTRGALGDATNIGGRVLCVAEARAYLVPNPVFRNMTECNYYVALALMDEKGEIYFLKDDTRGATNDFNVEHDIMWYGQWLDLERTVYVSELTELTQAGDYALVTVLREKGREGHLGNVYLPLGERLECSFTNGEVGYRLYSHNGQARLCITGAELIPDKGEDGLV